MTLDPVTIKELREHLDRVVAQGRATEDTPIYCSDGHLGVEPALGGWAEEFEVEDGKFFLYYRPVEI